MSDTLSYYTRQARQFIDGTLHTSMESIYREFLPLVPAGGSILDLGCGSGRDTLHFARRRYHVVPLDATREFVEHTFRLTGIRSIHATFADMELEPASFDAVWACASLLHVPSAELEGVIRRLAAALKPGGILYLSFKYGSFEGMRHGRYFTDMDEQTLAAVMERAGGFALVKQWVSDDVRPTRTEAWLNAIYRLEGGQDAPREHAGAASAQPLKCS